MICFVLYLQFCSFQNYNFLKLELNFDSPRILTNKRDIIEIVKRIHLITEEKDKR